MQEQLVNFISNDDLIKHVKFVLDKANESFQQADKNLHKNVIDPFSAMFDAVYSGISYKEWLDREKNRQVQKTLQNHIGEFHQKILGSIGGWEDLDTGGVVDIKSDTDKVIAEVKNKFNTTKGNHKVAIYDDLHALISTNYRGYKAYYIEIIPSNKNRYDKPFTPPDNKTHKRRPENKDIRVIDGYSFYELATGQKNALRVTIQACNNS